MGAQNPDPKNATLNKAIRKLKKVRRAVDLRWLSEELHARLDPAYHAKLHGYKGGHENYIRTPELDSILDMLTSWATPFTPADLETLELVVDLLYGLLAPQSETTAKGGVQLKTIKKRYPEIDFKTGLPVLDDAGKPILMDFYYTYAYIRIYAGRGDADRKGSTQKPHYADRGMGKGGSGGVVAAALRDDLVTEDEILTAWHKGGAAYSKFIDHCAELLGKGEESDDQD